MSHARVDVRTERVAEARRERAANCARVAQAMVRGDLRFARAGDVREHVVHEVVVNVAVELELVPALSVEVPHGDVPERDALGELVELLPLHELAADGVEQQNDRREALLSVDDVEEAVAPPRFVLHSRRSGLCVEHERSGVVLLAGAEQLEVFEKFRAVVVFPSVAALVVGHAQHPLAEYLFDRENAGVHSTAPRAGQ